MKRLKRAELDSVYKQIKQFADYQKDVLRPLVGHIEWQKKKIEQLESELNKINNPQLFMKEERIQAVAAKLTEELSAPKEYFPLAKRLSMMEQGSEEWVKTLKWNKLSEAEALETIKNNFDK
jgi:hypothetical protein